MAEYVRRLASTFPSAFAQALRMRLAGWWLLLIIVVPTLSTINHISITVNRRAALLMAGFALLLLPETLRELRRWWRHPDARLLAAVLLFCVTAWHFHQGTSGLNGQAGLYAGAAVFSAALIAWLRARGASGLLWIFQLKLATVLIIAACFTVAIVWTQSMSLDLTYVYKNLPVYRNIRHFNYELMMATAIAFICYVTTPRRWQRNAALGALCIFGYLSMWSAGRAALLTTVIFLALLCWAIFSRAFARSLLWPVLALLVGCGAAFMVGHAELLLGRFSQVSNGYSISSGRTQIWGAIFLRIFESPAAALYGYGPDAFRLMQWGKGIASWLVQAHNAFMQWLIEFGLLGGALLGMLWVRQALHALGLYRDRDAGDLTRMSAAVLVALFCYSLLDGVLYHAVPLITIIFFVAWLVVRRDAAAHD